MTIWFHAGCGCSYGRNEQSGPQEVCAEIQIINGTELTTSDYTVTVTAENSTAYSEY